MGAYELLMRQVRRVAGDVVDRRGEPGGEVLLASDSAPETSPRATVATPLPPDIAGSPAHRAEAKQGQPRTSVSRSRGRMRSDSPRLTAAAELQQRAHAWALEKRASDGALPTGRAIAQRFGRSDRWGRLIKRTAIQKSIAESS